MLDTIKEERVARGAAWLDVVKPGWEKLVNPDTLDVMEPSVCVLGQAFAEEARGLSYSGYSYAIATYRLMDVKDRGFAGDFLESAWREEIAKRVGIRESVLV